QRAEPQEERPWPVEDFPFKCTDRRIAQKPRDGKSDDSSYAKPDDQHGGVAHQQNAALLIKHGWWRGRGEGTNRRIDWLRPVGLVGLSGDRHTLPPLVG